MKIEGAPAWCFFIMAYIQLITPDLSVTGKSGYCLEMQENVWGSLHWYDYAEQSWNQNGPNHPSEQPPNVCVPVYWTYYDTAAGTEYGHVATWVPGKGVYSSTFNTALGAEWYPSIQAMTDRINQISGANSHYLGWSEVIANLTLVKGDTMPSAQDVQDYITAWTGAPATAKQIADYTSQGWRILTDDVLKFREDAYKAQLATLQASVDQLTAANQKLVEQLTALKAQPAPDGFNATDRATLNFIQRAIATVFRIN